MANFSEDFQDGRLYSLLLEGLDLMNSEGPKEVEKEKEKEKETSVLEKILETLGILGCNVDGMVTSNDIQRVESPFSFIFTAHILR